MRARDVYFALLTLHILPAKDKGHVKWHAHAGRTRPQLGEARFIYHTTASTLHLAFYRRRPKADLLVDLELKGGFLFLGFDFSKIHWSPHVHRKNVKSVPK